MSNVNHRYSSESWTLDLSGKRSPLSRWTGKDVLRDEQFRLSLLGAQGGIAPVVWLSGDRPCFEALHKVVEAYVQQGLGKLVLAGKSTFPSGATETPVLDSSSPASPQPQSNASQFSIEALGQLRHSLNYNPQDSSSPRQMQLSTLQLADLLAVLDQWQTETLTLPESSSRLRVLPGGKDEFVMPTWGRIAASLMVALGATGLGAYVLSQRLPGAEQQVALESTAPASEGTASPNVNADAGSAFGSFPTASGPPITTQAQDGDTPFNNPFLQPQTEQDLPAGDPPTPPNITFPTPLPSSDDLGQVPLPPATPAALPSSDLPASIPATSDADSQSAGSPPPEQATANLEPFTETAVVVPEPGAVLGGGTVPELAEANKLPTSPAFSEPSADRPLLDDSPTSTSASDITAEETIAAAPIFAPPPEKATAATSGNSSTEVTDPEPVIAPAPPISASTASRVGLPSPEVQPPAAVVSPAPLESSPPSAPPAPQVTVAKPLPANNQSRAVQSYLQSQWKPPATIQQPLQYRLSISPEGNLSSLEPLSPTAQLYVNDANLPSVGAAIGGAADTVQSTMVVTLTPSGQVNVAIEKETPVR